MNFTLGVLDQSPVPEGATPTAAIANTLDLAQHCERFGYVDYWLAEHHNSEALAGSSPEVMVAAVAAVTNSMNIGPGGVMLSHYSSYKVAELFRTLAALYPGRIKFGIGRAPGANRVAAAALAKGPGALGPDHYPRQVRELIDYLNDTPDPKSAFAHLRASPRIQHRPPVTLLASSSASTAIAAELGIPLSFAHFITTSDGPEIVADYRRRYQPSIAYPEPIVNVAVAAVCAPTRDEADFLASSVRAWRANDMQGKIPAPSTATIGPYPGNPTITDTPELVATKISELADTYGAESVSIVTIVHDHFDRVRSYRLIAEAFGLEPEADPMADIAPLT